LLGYDVLVSDSSVPAATGIRPRPGRAPHRRSSRARDAVLEAADDLLVERGYAGVTIEGIAERAGVAKQTIYRWWPSKFEILMDTFLDDAENELKIPDTGSTAEDLRKHLRRLARFLTKEPAGQVMLALIGQAQHDRAIAAVFQQRYLDERRALDRTILERGVARGDVRDDIDLDFVVDVLYGPLYHRVLLAGLPVNSQFIDALVDNVFQSLAGRPPDPR
jgi:AcrR family transcriptional regulator